MVGRNSTADSKTFGKVKFHVNVVHYAFRAILTHVSPSFLLLIIAFVIRVNTSIIVMQIGNGEKWCFWHSIIIAKPTF